MQSSHANPAEVTKRLVAVIGSPCGEKSNTFFLVSEFIKCLQSSTPNLKVEILNPYQANIKNCDGCLECLKTHHCVIEDDDLGDFEAKLLAADAMIWGSPVYLHQIPGSMKNLLDRLTYRMHQMSFMGIPSALAVMTHSTGSQTVLRYLDMIMRLYGSVPVVSMKGLGRHSGDIPYPEKVKAEAARGARIFEPYLTGRKQVKPNLMNQMCFWVTKRKVIASRAEHPVEYEYWQKKGWLEIKWFRTAMKRELTIRAQAAVE